MVNRVYVQKKPGLRYEADGLMSELREYLGLKTLEDLQVINRYDVEGLDEPDFLRAVACVFSEPQVDDCYWQLSAFETRKAFALEYLPGQYDQRADSAAQCIQLLTQRDRPLVRTAKIYLLTGELSEADVKAAMHYVLNPVESRGASFDLPETLGLMQQEPQFPPILHEFRQMDSADIRHLRHEYDLAMEEDDIRFCMAHFTLQGRDPTLAELKVIDTYWSDHCRHTTFLTEFEDVECLDPDIRKTWEEYQRAHQTLRPDSPYTLMDVATLAAEALKRAGRLPDLVESEENNACTIRVRADTLNGKQDWLLLFKNETHNHPTEIEPFGGAATCIGGAIRDPLSARVYVYAAMRVTGAGDPTQPIEDTHPGKLPQRSITIGAAKGYSSYGNQIGLATGLVKEFYHPGYTAKHMEIGAVLGAAKENNVRRERPTAGDAIVLVGGRTGRDGIGGATGSSMAHTQDSVSECAAQVQKGNAPEERKLQRLFLNTEVTRLIKRCNDFGAGGVSVAIGELARGLDIDLDKVPLKYAGLGGTEIAISESQERMAVVVAKADVERFCQLANQENLEATEVARVTGDETLTMHWQGHTIVSLSRAFLDSNGALKKTRVRIDQPSETKPAGPMGFRIELMRLARDLKGASSRGLAERFDATIGAATLLMPFGGRHQLTPPMAMAHLLPVPEGTNTCSFMSYGFDPFMSADHPYRGGYLAVVEALAALAATGADTRYAYLTHQEYFPKPGQDPTRWGLPLASLLGAYRAQMELKVAAIGGKDSMSGSFHNLDVPPTLVSFAVAVGNAQDVISPEFKLPGHKLVWLRPQIGKDRLPIAGSLLQVFDRARELMRAGKVAAAATPRMGGAGFTLMLMALGNGIGARINPEIPLEELFTHADGSLILELTEEMDVGEHLGWTMAEPTLSFGCENADIYEFLTLNEEKMEKVYPTQAKANEQEAPLIITRHRPIRGPSFAKPRVLIPVFPGTNCELDTARAFERSGALPEILMIRNLQPYMVRDSVREMAARIRDVQIVLIPGGFSSGDEPDGSGKFITAFFRSMPVQDAVTDLLEYRKGLLGGICNGFQALIKLGLVPNGRITTVNKYSPTLSQNLIGRHQSRLVRVRIASTLSPWYSRYEVGEVQTLPVSHGEGRLLCGEDLLKQFAQAGQIATQYADEQGVPSMDIRHNPNGSVWAVESLTSPDGRVMGRMGHAERAIPGLYRNVPHNEMETMFLSAVDYYR